MTPAGLDALTSVGLPLVLGSVAGGLLGAAVGSVLDRARARRKRSRRTMVTRVGGRS